MSRFQYLRHTAVAVATVLIAVQANAQSVNDMTEEQLIAAAKEEGNLTFYGGTVNGNPILAAAFEEKYGIAVQHVRLSSVPLMQRFAAEAESGAINADVFWSPGITTPFMTEGMEKGWFEPLTDAKLPLIENGEYPDNLLVKLDGKIVAAVTHAQFWGIAYNTRMITGDNIPQSWQDLADDKYAGLITISSPAISAATQQLFRYLFETYGDEYVQKLVANSKSISDSNSTTVQVVAAGEAPIGVPVVSAAANRTAAEGAPIAWLSPPDTFAYDTRLMLVSPDKALHPAAARLFAMWLLSEEGGKLASSSPADGIVSMYDEAFQDDYTVVPDMSPEETDKVLTTLGLK